MPRMHRDLPKRGNPRSKRKAPKLDYAAYMPKGHVQEWRFDLKDKRKWKFDFAWINIKIAVEVQGFGHHRLAKARKDWEKYNEAQLQGWMVGQFSPAQVKRGEASAWVYEAAEARGKHYLETINEGWPPSWFSSSSSSGSSVGSKGGSPKGSS